jgi:threonine/homoserine/homoserine lactone efflux protein
VLSPAALASFAAAAFVLIVIPGPSVLFVISRGVSLGRRAAVLTVLGNACGAAVQVMAVAAGVGAGTARSWFADRPHRLERLGAAGGLAIVGLGARLALTGRRD